jgi:hypothetical protein
MSEQDNVLRTSCSPRHSMPLLTLDGAPARAVVAQTDAAVLGMS